MLELCRAVDRTAGLAVVAVLVLGAAFGALALDEAIGQEHVFVGVEELLDDARADQSGTLQIEVDGLRKLVVLGRVGGVPVVEADLKSVQIRLAAGRYVGYKLLRRLAGLLGGDHDRRAVRIVGADEVHKVTRHPLVPNPDIGLDVLHHVTDVHRSIGVGQGGGYEECALHRGFAQLGGRLAARAQALILVGRSGP